MLPRLYLLAGSVLVFGYAASSLMGLEFGNTVIVVPAPPRGALIVANTWGRSSTYHSSSSTYRGSPVAPGPTGGK